MDKARIILMSIFLFLCVSGAAAQTDTRGDSTIIEQTPCPANQITAYEPYVEARRRSFMGHVAQARKENISYDFPTDFTARILTKAEFERRRASEADVDCQRIKYLSDGLKVVGYIWKPKSTEDRKLPLIIFNRGGGREDGKLTPWSGIHRFVSEGFVVIGSQYRGNDGGEGREEFGGADVRDVMNLIPLARSLGYVDMNNVFMYGVSRGGMMAYLTLKNNIPVNSVAVTGGVVDIPTESKYRPGMVIHVYREYIPDFDKRSEELMRERSALYWADKINVPVLILHGGEDWRVRPSLVLAFAQKLQEYGKTYELIIYGKDDHGITLNKADEDRRIIHWFRRHMK